MFRPFEAFIGIRYTRAKRRDHFISLISLVSMLGIAVGVTALITVLSVMNGFGKEIRERIVGAVAHVNITGAFGPISEWQSLIPKLERQDHVVAAAPFVAGEGMLMRGQVVSGAVIRGILPNAEPGVSEVGAKMVAGRLEFLQPGRFGVVLGKALADRLGVWVGDRLTLLTPEARITALGPLPRVRALEVVGIFNLGIYDYDSVLAMVHLEDGARLYLTPGEVSGVRLKLDDMFNARGVTMTVGQALGAQYRVTDWTRQHANFFRALKTEKTAMFVILFLIVGVAVFNLVSTLVVTVSEKQSDIAILRTLGATPASIMKIFLVQGTLIGLVGTVLGAVAGVTLALNVESIVPALERLFGTQFLAADVYQISEVPSDLHWIDVAVITTTAFVLSLMAALYPAWRAAQTQPAEALRYE